MGQGFYLRKQVCNFGSDSEVASVFILANHVNSKDGEGEYIICVKAD